MSVIVLLLPISSAVIEPQGNVIPCRKNILRRFKASPTHPMININFGLSISK